MFGAIPPAPIAPLRREDRLVGTCELYGRLGPVGRRPLGGPLVHLTRVAQQIPGAYVLCMTDPHVEIRAYPRCRENSLEARLIRHCLDSLAGRHRADFRILLDASVEFPQKVPAISRVVFPGILPVKYDAHRRRPSCRLAVPD